MLFRDVKIDLFLKLINYFVFQPLQPCSSSYCTVLCPCAFIHTKALVPFPSQKKQKSYGRQLEMKLTHIFIILLRSPCGDSGWNTYTDTMGWLILSICMRYPLSELTLMLKRASVPALSLFYTLPWLWICHCWGICVLQTVVLSPWAKSLVCLHLQGAELDEKVFSHP